LYALGSSTGIFLKHKLLQKHDKKNIKKKPKTQDKGENQSNAPIVSGIASN
jgi:hypothetical protein